MDDLAKVMFNGGRIYLCGSLQMGKDIMAVIEHKIKEYLKETGSTQTLYQTMKKFKKNDQIIRELWG